ncbi:hypothetical protein [Klebsiella oxytoca]|uniref:hypothetical protein n=1 Tax=Klebsiella oxytoca TaxID=571 RepID=UPI0029856265|nr:hypothetical protein [Klebsiella oxytoca]MEB2852715.1 hypothetical protein [Klebsiella oxytoca]MEB2878947.1 hypothetical protein [Klebsiella oxytoca]HEG4359145.1 hypothetical protein [Klebsiella oxytoca]HEG4389761.1 hypothetical protein [Klebsiella oxytoca]
MIEDNTFNKVVISKHSRNGSINKANLSQNQLRTHCVSVRLNNDELQCLNAKRGDRSKGEWLRLAFLEKLPIAVPAINIEAWKSLSEISQKLNKLVAHLDNKSQGSSLTQTELFAVKRQISELRINLVGADLWGRKK